MAFGGPFSPNDTATPASKNKKQSEKPSVELFEVGGVSVGPPPPPVAAAPRHATGLTVSFGDTVECRDLKSGATQHVKVESIYEKSLKKLEEAKAELKDAEKS